MVCRHYAHRFFGGGHLVGLVSWVYWAGLYESKFEAYCAAAWIEGDKRVHGRRPPAEVQLYKTDRGKYGIRFR